MIVIFVVPGSRLNGLNHQVVSLLLVEEEEEEVVEETMVAVERVDTEDAQEVLRLETLIETEADPQQEVHLPVAAVPPLSDVEVLLPNANVCLLPQETSVPPDGQDLLLEWMTVEGKTADHLIAMVDVEAALGTNGSRSYSIMLSKVSVDCPDFRNVITVYKVCKLYTSGVHT